jgi:hypothetical protein
MDRRGSISATWPIERRTVFAVGFTAATLLALPNAELWAADASKPTYVYVGSYTKNPPGGGSSNPIGLSVFQGYPPHPSPRGPRHMGGPCQSRYHLVKRVSKRSASELNT